MLIYIYIYMNYVTCIVVTELPKKIISETQSKTDGHFVDTAARWRH